MPDTATSVSAADSRTYTISELAREFGVTPRALRFYEDKDMLHPERDGMMRVYRNRDRGRLKVILQCKRVGLPLADIREILDLYGTSNHERTQKLEALKKYRNQVETLKQQREDIDAALAELHNGIAWLEDQLSKIGPGANEARDVAAYEQVAKAHLDGAVAKTHGAPPHT
ncbi:MAG: MerR family DNA-binding transcriptional regulator, partial [Hyphomonadaceae bacterium]|nr:MerR family DNA-binding transcriptional regulator [Hyphomonadaceae bacterium]